jgi:hypothetical protein
MKATSEQHDVSEGETGSQFRKVIFLDTNNLHYALLYLEFAEAHKLPPFSEDHDRIDVELQREFHARRRTFDDYVKGKKVVEYLRSECRGSDVEVLYGSISSLELICGLLRGGAMLEAANARLAHRMWGHMDEHEILERLTPEVYREVLEHASNIQAQFAKAGIIIGETTSDRVREAWSVARSLLRYVYLEVGDAVVYASALLSLADELLSGDGYLRKVANCLQNPTALKDERDKSRYGNVREGIRAALVDLTGFEGSAFRFPRARGV